MNDQALADMRVELDLALARQKDPNETARQILNCVEQRAPGSVLRLAAGIQLRRLGCATATGW
ncbi:hypothetical protein [Brevundimonas sp.]|uniref:hypothetical protein n=1 Tax=Brevundimonas sp. TaxID=1871086 RepID=UPI003BADAAF4